MAALERRYGDALRCTALPGDRGIFDVVVDGDLIFSKHERGRFPGEREIFDGIDARLNPG